MAFTEFNNSIPAIALNKRALLLVITLLLVSLHFPANSAISLEHKVKAAYVFKLLKFIEWQENQEPLPGNNINICIIGSDPVLEAVRLLDSKKAKGRTINVTQKGSLDNMKTCQIVFIARSEKNNIDNILKKLKSRNYLTISDIQGFSSSGGMIELATIDNKVKLIINRSHVNESNLSLSSKLLNIAILTGNKTEKTSGNGQ
jgi:hypothetical protein